MVVHSCILLTYQPATLLYVQNGQCLLIDLYYYYYHYDYYYH